MTIARMATLCVVMLAAGAAAGQTGPQLLTVFPPGTQAGGTVEATFTGSGFDGDEKLLFSDKGFRSERIGESSPDPKKAKGPRQSSVRFKITAPNGFSGPTDVRVVSKSGLSNPRTFMIGDRTEAAESEPNSDIGQAHKIALETTVNGVISSPTDVDYVRFPAKAGQNIVVHCLTSSVDSRLSADILVSTADGKPLAVNRAYRGGDAVLDFKAPADGDYLVRVAQFAYTTGGSDHFYRLTVTTGPWVDAVFPPLDTERNGAPRLIGRNLGATTVPGGSLLPGDRTGKLQTGRAVPPSAAMIDATDAFRQGDGHLRIMARNPVILDTGSNTTAEKALDVKVPCDIAGRIATKGERRYYSFGAKKGEVWTLEVFADRIGSPIDAYFILSDAKGKAIVEMDDGPAPLSPNQFYTRSDDPDRYRFVVPADGTYRVMVSSRDAGIQFGDREQFVLRIAKENPDFRLAVMPITPHIPDAGSVAKGGAVLFAVFVFRLDGFSDAIALEAKNLPPGVTCPPQSIPAGQSRGTLVLLADTRAKDWDGFITVTGSAGKLERTARPFSVTWPIPGVQANQAPPNVPTITRLDRGPGLALAVRGAAPFSLTPLEKELKTTPGGKLEVTLRVKRDAAFKDSIAVFSAVPGFGPRQQGNQPPKSIATLTSDKQEAKVTIEVAGNLAPGVYSLVLNGQSGAPQPKGPNAQPHPAFPTVPITVVVGRK